MRSYVTGLISARARSTKPTSPSASCGSAGRTQGSGSTPLVHRRICSSARASHWRDRGRMPSQKLCRLQSAGRLQEPHRKARSADQSGDARYGFLDIEISRPPRKPGSRPKPATNSRRVQIEAETRQRGPRPNTRGSRKWPQPSAPRSWIRLPLVSPNLRKKNLSYRIASELPSVRMRSTDNNSATGQLDQGLQVVMQRVRNITGAMEQIPSASDNLSQRTQKTAAPLEESELRRWRKQQAR